MIRETIKGKVPLLDTEKSSQLASQNDQQDDDTTDATPNPTAPAEPQDNDAMRTSSEARTKFLDALKKKIDKALFEGATESRKLVDVDFIYLVDSGGQPPFREMLPHFVQRASAIVLMQKLNERLDFKPTIRYREEGGKVGKGYTSQLTNEQILHQYIQGVQSHKSRVFVVGTHSDLERECEGGETRDMKNTTLLEAFEPVLGEQLVLYKAGTRNNFCSLWIAQAVEKRLRKQQESLEGG